MTEHDGNGMEEGMEIVPGLSWDEVHVLHISHTGAVLCICD